jgi:Fe-S cluster biosynthesis and repair protein YggX
LAAFFFVAMKCIPPLIDLYSPKVGRQGTLMPALLNLWYEQLAYHKILPSVCNLSMKILRSHSIWAAACSRFENCRVCDNFPGTLKIMSEHKVFCAKLKQDLPGLEEPPFDSELGQKIYNQVSQQAWSQWTEYCKMLLNEYRLNPARKQDQEVIVKQMEQFFFGEGAAPPAQYVPPTH